MNSLVRHRMRLVLAIVAVVYALLACLRTVGDFDTGWQLATGRYLSQHHAVPSVDVLSYTSAGTPWHYPPFAGAVLYTVFHFFGFAGLSWFCALTAALLAAYLLWRALPVANLASIVLLVLAVPSLAYRFTPRADLFTTLFFAIFIAELWRYHRGQSARLWLLPPVMLLWVNLHPGFIAGLGLLAGFALIEVLQLPFRDLRVAALRRLAKSVPWLAATSLATLANPWGFAAFQQASVLAGYGGGNSSHETPRFVGELSGQPLSWHVIPQAFHLRDPDSAFWWLLAVAAVAILQALRRREFGAAIVLAVSISAALQRLRYQGLFSIAVVVIAGTLFIEAFANLPALKPRVIRTALNWGFAALFALLLAVTALRITDLTSDRYYLVSASTSHFGPGESWWFPERAAAFIQQQKLLGNIFQPYNLGGFTALRLGPTYPVYSDGRGISPAISTEEQALLSQSPDSPQWQQVASQRNINVILLSLARYGALGGFDLNAFCNATQWRPVYLDEVSIVLLRRTPQNQPWLSRFQLDCQTAQFPVPEVAYRKRYDYYANSGAVLYALGRDTEALDAWHHALALAPEDPNIHLFLAQLHQQQQHPQDAEREYRAALSRRESSVAFYALGRLLATEHRYQEAEPAIETAAEMTITPANQYKALGQVQLHLNKPQQVLESLLKAERAGPSPDDPSPSARDFHAQIADGRGAACMQLQNAKLASEYFEKSLQLSPNPQRWSRLADSYAAQGRTVEAEQARNRAKELPASE